MFAQNASIDVLSSRKRKEMMDDEQFEAQNHAKAQQEPLYLKKVFAMITEAPVDIAAWTATGETFVVKDPIRFEKDIIPTVFKHSKFSSFVRQLNFYGFRKVRPHAANQDNWWEFRHPYFRRDQPELMCRIKKSLHFDVEGNPIQQNGGSVANELQTLKKRVIELEDTITNLTNLVRSALEERNQLSCETLPMIYCDEEFCTSSVIQEPCFDALPLLDEFPQADVSVLNCDTNAKDSKNTFSPELKELIAEPSMIDIENPLMMQGIVGAFVEALRRVGAQEHLIPAASL